MGLLAGLRSRLLLRLRLLLRPPFLLSRDLLRRCLSREELGTQGNS